MTHPTESSQSESLSPELLSPDVEERYLKLAQTAALQAGKLQQEAFGSSLKVMTKGSDIDLVTTVDRESDVLITDILRKACPDDYILSEEQFEEGHSIPLTNTWVIDPLDGTTNYAHGFPHFAVSIAYFWRGKPQIGVVYNPLTKEMFYAIRNRGAFLNDTPIFTSNNRAHDLAHALLATGFPYDIATSEVNNINHFQRIAPRCHGVRRPGAAALDLAYVASGRLDGFWELKLSIWDVAAGILLVEEAGGKVTTLDGHAIPYPDRHIHLISSNGSGLHEELQALIALDR
jgi:myo-inositol-1(or 4)-monophosphatase